MLQHLLNFRQRSRLPLILVSLLALGLAVLGSYLCAGYRLSAAREARRNDSYAEADYRLQACWRLPGLGNPIDLERTLLGVQQGDLTTEAALQARARPPSSDSLLILEALAKGSLATFRWNEALMYAEALLERQPGHAQALWLRGRALVKLQQENKAEGDLIQAVERDPASFEIRLTLAEFFQQQGFPRQAEAHYEYLRRQQPAEARVLLGLARCRHDDADLTGCREILDDLLAAQPQLVAALVERGRLALRLAEPAEAEQWLTQAVTLSPHDQDANFLLRLCLDAQGEDNEQFRRKVALDERLRAELWRKLRDTPHDPAVNCEIGRWMMRTGQEHQSAGWFFLALREDPHFPLAHAGLADYFDRAGQPIRARSHRKRADGASGGQDRSAGFVSTNFSRPAGSGSQPTVAPPPPEASSEQVHQFCGECHAYPPPESMPRSAWRKEVKLAFDFLRDSTLHGEFPSLESVALYYENRAPQRLPMVERTAPSTTPPMRFGRKEGRWLANVPPYPAVAHVSLVRLFDDQKLDVLVCDTRLDRVLALKPYETAGTWQVLGPALVPSHATVIDLDGDGRKDILVASLGQFFPTDDKVGSVVWLRGLEGGKFTPITLLDSVGRLADVEAADFNGDGRLDLVVAVFGWRKTGEILYLENQTTDRSRLVFVPHQVDGRHGSIHVPVADLNHDGRPDFVALISQEHETVVAFLNAGDGTFRKETIFTAPQPNYGSSGIELVDLDGDGDLDVLLTNGDVLDRPYVLKPYHGVQWLENRGIYPFTHHPLVPLYGASRAVAADLDGDQDLDIVAVSFLPGLEFPEREPLRLPSVVLLEQTEPRQFTPHVLETGTCDHFSCAAGDWDGDGRADLAIGNFSWKRSQPIADGVLLWNNTAR